MADKHFTTNLHPDIRINQQGNKKNGGLFSLPLYKNHKHNPYASISCSPCQTRTPCTYWHSFLFVPIKWLVIYLGSKTEWEKVTDASGKAGGEGHREELRSLLTQSSWLVLSPFAITTQVLRFFLRWVMVSPSEPDSAFRIKKKAIT